MAYQQLKGTVFPFRYNDFESSNLVNSHQIGVIKMEVARNMGPENDFLRKVREFATKRILYFLMNALLASEKTSGGLHLKYGVGPISRCLGKRSGMDMHYSNNRAPEIMEVSVNLISSTLTERIGVTAALKTLEVMDREKSWKKITTTGLNIRSQWQQLADKHGLNIEHWGLPALTGFTIKSEQSLAYKTLITQDMLSKGYLAGNSVYVCTEQA